jgi:signal transduction histidine kinase
MGINLVIKKTTAYRLVTSGITFSYVMVVLAFEFLLRNLWGYSSFWAAALAALAIAVTFVPLRDRLQKITDQIFFHRTIVYQDAIREVTRMVISVTDLRTLFRLIDHTIMRVMCMKNAAILLLEEKEECYLIEKTNGLPQTLAGTTFSLSDPLILYLKEKKDTVALEEVKSLLANDLTEPTEKEKLKAVGERLESLRAAVAVPSFSKGKLVGVLTLGEKLSGELYSPDDLELLLTMASEAAIAIENAKLYQDITQVRDNLNNLIQKNDAELKKVDQLKREFLSVISHELRTPLTPIKGYLSLIMNGDLGVVTPKQRKAFSVILNQTNHLHNLIDTVIDISRIEVGKPLELEREPLLIRDLVEKSVEFLSPSFETKNIKVETNYLTEPITLLGDRKKLLRVFNNLLENTLKFTPSGGKTKISVEKDAGQIKVTLADSGIGIAPNYLVKIFERFFQVDSTYTRAAGGIGMGLALTKEIIDAHSGKIWAESEGLGRGSRFVFTLPVDATPASTPGLV